MPFTFSLWNGPFVDNVFITESRTVVNWALTAAHTIIPARGGFMKRTVGVVALAVLGLLGLVTPVAFAQVPTPTVKINGLIDNLAAYTSNFGNFDGNLARKDTAFYGRTRGRFDITGEIGKAKGVLGLEIDAVYGQTGFSDSNNNAAAGCVTNSGGSVVCGTQNPGEESSFDLNTDTQGNLQVKWLYVEFPVPLAPVPTIARLGAQPFGQVATYKLATYASGDFGGAVISSTITPNVRLNFAYVGVEEALSGKKSIIATPLGIGAAGSNAPQSRGDDFAFIVSPEIAQGGLELKPLYSYFFASGATSGAARVGRGGYGINISTAPNGTAGGSPFAPKNVSGADGVGTSINENRQTVGLDARWRSGPFRLDPTVFYQFGNRNSFNTVTPAYGVLCNGSGNAAANCAKDKANLSAWLVDVRAGYQLGPLLLEGLTMWTSGNRAQDNLRRNVNFYQVLDNDTTYLFDWGTQVTSIGSVEYNAVLNPGATNLSQAVGLDKYGRIQLGLRGTYALTPELTIMGGWNIIWTDKSVDTDGTVVPGGGILPSFVDRTTGRSARPEGDARLIGNELMARLTWQFAPGLAFDYGAGYLFAGGALGHRTIALPYCEAGQVAGCAPPNRKDIQVNDVYVVSARVRYTF
jgi:hypothetical protein